MTLFVVAMCYAVTHVRPTLVAEETVCTMYAEIQRGKLGNMLVAFGLKKHFDDSLLLLPPNAWTFCHCSYSSTCSVFLWYVFEQN